LSEPALRAPAYIKIAAGLISEHGWCGSRMDPIANDKPMGLNLTRAATWAVGGVHCLARDLTPEQAEHVAEVMDHLEAPLGFGVPVFGAEKDLAGVSAANVALELLLMAVRYELSLVDVA
jgi:hypothetical protein